MINDLFVTLIPIYFKRSSFYCTLATLSVQLYCTIVRNNKVQRFVRRTDAHVAAFIVSQYR